MELINILGSKDEPFSTRRNAARTLGRSGKLSEVAKSALLDILKASPPYASDLLTEEREQRQQLRSLSQEAGRALGAAGPSIIDDLLPLVTPLENPFRTGAMEALVRLGKEGVPRLAELLAHQDEAVRVSASVALNRIGKPSVPALINASSVVSNALASLRVENHQVGT